MRIYRIICCVLAIIANFLILGSLLYVIAPRVPCEAKDGLFGAAAGLIAGTVPANIVIALAYLNVLRKKPNSNTEN